MYEELVKSLRAQADYYCCHMGINSPPAMMFIEAADAIEDLQAQLMFSNDAAKAIAEKVPKWIPVTERLPEENEAVNIVFVNKNPPTYYQAVKDKPQRATGVYYRGRWYWWSAVVQDILAEYGKWEPDEMDNAIDVTHWMPLPEPPKADKDGDNGT